MSDPAKRVLRVLVVDDEALARQRLIDLLAHERDVEVVGTAEHGSVAIDMIRQLHPDVVLLDVQMPGKTGIDVVREIGADEMPATIFVTAYDQFAIKAFDLAAVDYLVKPFDDERFEQALARARQMVNLSEVDRLSGLLRSVLTVAVPEGPAPAARPAYLERIAVEMRGQVRIVPVEQIDYVEASGAYAELHVGSKMYLVRERMQELEERLDPAVFFRVHRSAIVRLAQVESLLRAPGGDYAVQLKGGARLKVSRSRYEELGQKMGLTG
jgi:two-component system LytT family response regulator